jgi:hypothetical protein
MSTDDGDVPEDKKQVAEERSVEAREEVENMLGTWTPGKCPWPGS